MRLLPLLCLLLACAPGEAGVGGDDSGGGGDGGSGGGDGGSGGDGGGGDGGGGDGGGEAVPVYPTGERVLLSYGNGGLPAQSTGKASFLDVELRWEALGYSLHHKDALPEDLSSYRLIGLVAPGATAPASFTSDEVARLDAARRAGARIAVLGDPAMCADPGVASLLDALGTDAGFEGDAYDENQVVTTSDLAADQQPTAGVSTLRLRDPCVALAGRGAVLVRDADGAALASLHRPSDGGDIVILGDLEVLDDGYLDREDNALLADNLARVTP